MLADHFKVVLHHELPDVPVYALLVTKKGEFGPTFPTTTATHR